MRARLLESALRLMATRGLAGTSVDEVIADAQVSRGTFYKYFETPTALIQELAREVAGDLIRILDPLVRRSDDPAERLAVGLRAALRLVRAHPLLGGFIVRTGWPLVGQEPAQFDLVTRDLLLGIKQGRFKRMHIDVARNLVAGSAIGGFYTLSSGRAPRDYPEQAAACTLRALGVAADEAERIATLKFTTPEIADDTVVGRALAARLA